MVAISDVNKLVVQNLNKDHAQLFIRLICILRDEHGHIRLKLVTNKMLVKCSSNYE